MPRLTCLFNWRATYQTKPAQSKPRGVEPPHTYGEPRSWSAAPARPSPGAPGGTATTAMGAAGLGDGEVVGVAIAREAGAAAAGVGEAVGLGEGVGDGCGNGWL